MKTIVIDIEQLSERVERMSLCEKFLCVNAKSQKVGIPILDDGHRGLLGLFWRETVVRMSAMLSGWMEASVSYDSLGIPAKITISHRKGAMKADSELMQIMIEDALVSRVMMKIGEVVWSESDNSRLRAVAESAVDNLLAALL